LSSYVGYANAAGFKLNFNISFLMNRGMFSGLPSQSEDIPQSLNVDPITGMLVNKSSQSNGMDMMSDEEKEREADKLFVLFDKLNKTGVFKPINPFNLGNK
jgi:hypothetical protein